jgi:FkbM family methyltransferase
VTSPPFESYSQNGEDVVLWRALRGISNGRYIDVGANHPSNDSVSMAFYARGWTGITVEPDPEFAALLRQDRPGDLVVEAAITSRDHDSVVLHVVDGTGLSTLDDFRARVHTSTSYETHDIAVPTRTLDSVLDDAGWAGEDIHFVSVDTEGSEREVLESIDLTRWRPWVLVVEATEPNSTRPTRHLWDDMLKEAEYQFCLFDGLSCFFVADERSQQLGKSLSYPACVLDDFTTLAQRDSWERAIAAEAVAAQRADEVRALIEEVVRWRTEATSRWATALAQARAARDSEARLQELHDELHAWQQQVQELEHERSLLGEAVRDLQQRVAELLGSTSWRVTRPLRAASGAVGRARGSA